jgi:glyoxylase-like metal-dependent hydrolase (beta-lactamase superfamily II)
MKKPIIKQIPVGPMLNLAYIVGDADSGKCAVIDPGWDSDAILGAASNDGLKIEKILLTHAHFDHVGALMEIAAETKAPVYVHASEAAELAGDLDARSTEDGTTIEIGSLKVECLHTPGHTPGSQCFLVDGNIFTGDTLFVDGCGRVDLPGSSPKEMLVSLKRLAGLDAAITVWPGHDYGGPSSTIGTLIETNPYLDATGEAALL